MRLRPLTEAECYARCYGAVRSEQVSVRRSPSKTKPDRSAKLREPQPERREAA